jgi:glutamine synthetase
MAVSLKAIREGIAANIDPLEGFQVSAYALANPITPTVQVLPGQVVFDRAMRGGADDWTLTVQAVVPVTNDIGSQLRLDQLFDASAGQSMKDLIESDKTLGGVVETLRVTECSGYQMVALEGAGQRLLCEWTVYVIAKRN